MSIVTHLSSQETGERLHSAAIHLLRKLRKADAGSGLNASRMSALSVVVFAGFITLHDLAAAEQVRPPTMTRIVNALEAHGLVAKKPNVEDGRSICISATRAGKKLLFKSRKLRIRALARQIDALSPAEQLILRDAAQILRSIVRAI